MFLPLLGFAMMVTAVLKGRWHRPEQAFSIAILALFFAVSSHELSFWKEDTTHYSRAIEQNPASWNAHGFLGSVYATSEEWPAAERHFRSALEFEPTWQEARFQLALALLHQRRFEESLNEAQAALELDPQNPGFLRQVCWMLATAPEEQIRSPEEAMRLAQVFMGNEQKLIAEDYDTLSVVFAAVGQFDQATELATRAQQMYEATGQVDRGAAAAKRIELFLNRQAFIDELPLAP